MYMRPRLKPAGQGQYGAVALRTTDVDNLNEPMCSQGVASGVIDTDRRGRLSRPHNAREPSISLVIRNARSEDVAQVHAWHHTAVGEHIWPRTRLELQELATGGGLIIALDEQSALVGMCYVKEDREPDSRQVRWEFGGVFVAPEARNRGLATLLGAVAIASHLLNHQPPASERLIAHVHVENTSPRGFLVDQLGFQQDGQEIPPSELAPANMKRDADGNVVGDVFVFAPAVGLEKLAARLEHPDQIAVKVSPLQEGARSTAVTALRLMANSG